MLPIRPDVLAFYDSDPVAPTDVRVVRGRRIASLADVLQVIGGPLTKGLPG